MNVFSNLDTCQKYKKIYAILDTNVDMKGEKSDGYLCTRVRWIPKIMEIPEGLISTLFRRKKIRSRKNSSS